MMSTHLLLPFYVGYFIFVIAMLVQAHAEEVRHYRVMPQ